jgi:hypothetical protein
MTDTLIRKMKRTYGEMPSSMPAGFFKAVQFPILARLDTQTGDHRMLLSDGADTRDLPLTIRYIPSATYGHENAIVSGTLFEMTVDPETGIMSGQGFLLDDANGHTHARYIYTGALRGNSVDLAEVKARLVEDLESGEWWIEFTDFKLAATTGVATPAFADAHATVDDMSADELTAAMGDPMAPLVAEFDSHTVNIIGEPEMVEITASSGTVQPFDAFYRPESDIPHKPIIDADLNVYGHVALWESCWGDDTDRCIRPPRPSDGYASFNQPGVLTERGMVNTGPIFTYGGHRSAKSAPTIEQAYGGIENSWCDVRAVEGKHGPWISGRVRPGVPDEVVYAARASRISGHWVNGNLRGIVSVNVEAYNIPGTSFSTENDQFELVASFPTCIDETSPVTQLVFNFNSAEDLQRVAALIDAARSQDLLAEVPGIAPEATSANEIDDEWSDQLLSLLLEDDDEES